MLGKIVLALILSLMAAGAVVTLIVQVTVKWLKNKIKEKMDNKNAQKVFVVSVDQMVNKMQEGNEDKETLNELKKYDLAMAEVDAKGEVQNLELVKDTNDTLDKEVENLMREKKGQILITK